MPFLGKAGAGGALISGGGSAEEIYARAFDLLAAMLDKKPAGDAFKVQLLHYLPDTTFATRNRDVVGWTLSGALVSLLAHSTGGEPANELYRTREQGMAAWMPILGELLEPWDALILAHTATTGWGLVWSEPVAARINFWEMHAGSKFEAWLAAAKTAGRIRRQVTMPPLDDPLFPEAARIMICELKVLLAQVRSQSLANQKSPDLIQFFEQQAERKEFGFLNDPHNLTLWLRFVASNPEILLTQAKSPGAIFDQFQASVSGHDPDYIRQKRARG